MERMATAILHSDHMDLWKYVKKIKGWDNIVAASRDGLSDENDIAELFSKTYSELYNSVPFDHPEMHHIVNEIDARLVCEKCIYEIEFNDVKTAIAHLKLGKSDGEEGFNSDHVTYGSILLQKYFNLCF